MSGITPEMNNFHKKSIPVWISLRSGYVQLMPMSDIAPELNNF
jgi:hypothetical protein